MAYKVFAVPSYTGNSVDHLFCNPGDPNSRGTIHYAYAIGAERHDAIDRRMFPWANLQDFMGAYAGQHPDLLQRIEVGNGYCPGESALSLETGPTEATEHDTVFRLGALELLGNISSGRLSTTDKDPFPHQLALQQFVKQSADQLGPRRLLIADEVGLGKTVEAALILRDMVLARGRLEGFRVLYLTSGGLVEDAVAKLRDVLTGVIDGNNIVEAVPSFRRYGEGNMDGVRVASWHAARQYVSEKKKKLLPAGVRPEVIIFDECHHAASEEELAGRAVGSSVATQTYLAVKQLFAGEYWKESEAPRLGILMSATPFRTAPQFVNLLRLLTNGVLVGSEPFQAFHEGISASTLKEVLQTPGSPASVVWRRQSDANVRSWSGARIFPNLTVRRPYRLEEAAHAPTLPAPSEEFLKLIRDIKRAVAQIARNHNQPFGGLLTAHLEKMLTSSSIAGACWLFTWAVRRCNWPTQNAFKADQRPGIEGLRQLIRQISQRLAEANTNQEHATVNFPSQRFTFEAKELSQKGTVQSIYDFCTKLRERDDEDAWEIDDSEVLTLVTLAQRLLGIEDTEGQRETPQDLKLRWLEAMLDRHPNERFILFTESLQTCETLKQHLKSRAVVIEGRMGKPDRMRSVEELRDPKGTARVLIATAAADEGIDLQIASKVIHWDLSSSPATLMQRNGRAARLGQVRDVEAYYLVLRGTHEQRREDALRDRFADLGIQDESLKSRILGSLSEEENQKLEEAVEKNDDRVAGDILKKAKQQNDDMDQELNNIRSELEPAQVLSRADLAARLNRWKAIGLPESGTDGISYDITAIDWQRPVFEATSRFEAATAIAATVENERHTQTVVFDSEFFLFGAKNLKQTSPDRPRLAGLPPWISALDKRQKHRVEPYLAQDLLGKLLRQLARLRRADLLHLKKDCVPSKAIPPGASWLLFCTHPLREAENMLPSAVRPYLTFYAFPVLSEAAPASPLSPEGADAEAVHQVITAAEDYALAGRCQDGIHTEASRLAEYAGYALRSWVESVTRFGRASLRDEPRYFVPIPVALVRLIDGAES